MDANMPGEKEYILHNSRLLQYRSPFGALATGSHVELAVDVRYGCREVKLCYAYGLYSFNYCETEMRQVSDQPGRFHVSIRLPGEPGLFFYWFSVWADNQAWEAEEIKTIQPVLKNPAYYVCSRSKADGTGRISDIPPKVSAHEDRYPAAFQISVYRKDFKTPDWFKGALLYQIFPDRFYRGKDYRTGQMQEAKVTDERIYHEDWYEEVDILGKPQTGYLACDFFGGTLDGIREKVDYLQALHIDCLYLNPIFEARSNHRYDTADYMEVDPMLKGNPAFFRLVETLNDNGIRLLLDGVFSHTGADSRYFNKLGRYPEHGAYQAAAGVGKSPYGSWYSFFRDSEGHLAYDSWWGFTDLPNVNENDLGYRDFIMGKDGVVRTWLKRGAQGFRLDVSDELPDSFLRELRSAIKEESDGEGVILGEVWEDASNKISYGAYRDFLLGSTHDSVMGYTFRDAVLGFLTGVLSAQGLNYRLESFRENYPAEAYYCIMNLLSSHDVPRAMTVIAGAPDPGDRAKQIQIHMDEQQISRGMALVRLGLVIQMTYIGSPCIYYGDEIGMEGYRDPFNRRTYPWDRLSTLQEEQLIFFRQVTTWRRRFPVLKTGAYRTIWATGDAIIYERFLDEAGLDFFGKSCSGPKRVIVAINRSAQYSFSFSLACNGKESRFAPSTSSVGGGTTAAEVRLEVDTPVQGTLLPLAFQLYILE